MVKISFYTLFRLDLGIKDITLEIDKEISLEKLLLLAERKIGKKFTYKLIENGKLLNTAIVLVNGKNVHHLEGLKTLIKNGDKIDLFPPGGGG
ncbi:MoaD family protein [Hippea maritima]|uniref:ThiamineS protein n=1 Tax=Hippea maritima (strain ATCC 700847 / DSM 10411 / MH2) TaxID=760142 RepID=F2LVH4_HIPMA|nr:MoaD family protein [Hippea maritima]AEA33758.1 thiamineS protein [Hippea maritima DSM 10411]